MLNSLRKGASSWLAKLLIGLLVLAFATWGINDVFTTQTPSTVATVGDKKVSVQALQRAYQTEIRLLSLQFGRQITPEQARILRLQDRAMNRLISTAALDYHAEKLNLGIPERKVTQDILENPEFRGTTGNFSTDNFNRFLSSNNLTERYYIEQQKLAAIRNQITTALVTGLPAPEALLKAQNLYDNETRTVKFIDIPEKAIGKIKDPEEKDLKDYYEKNKSQFRAPEYRKVAYFVLSPKDVQKTISIDDETIKQSYEANKQNYIKEERREIQQISFPDIKKAEEAHKKLKAGKKFADIAKEAGQKESDTNLGIQTKDGIFDKTIAEAAFKLKKGAISEPIKGSLNTVIVKVTKIEPRVVTSLEKVKNQIRDELSLERANEEISSLQDNIEDERGNAELKDIAEKFNLQFKEVAIDSSGKDQAGKNVEPFSSSNQFTSNVFQSDVGNDNNAVEVNATDVAWFEVTDITLTRIKDFAEVEDQVKEKWLENQKSEALKNKAKDIIKALEAGEKIETHAKKLSVKVQKSKALKRNDNSDKLSRQAISRAFTMAKDKFADVSSSDAKSRTIFQLVDITKPKNVDKKALENLSARMAPQIANDIILQYIQGLQDSYGVTINNAALQAANSPRGSFNAPRGSF